MVHLRNQMDLFFMKVGLTIYASSIGAGAAKMRTKINRRLAFANSAHKSPPTID
jgi:hypothetical protein